MNNTFYQYSNHDLLENPQKYQQTKFEGKDFLNAYFKSRGEIIEEFTFNNNKKFNLTDSLCDLYNDSKILSNSEKIHTNNCLLYLLYNKITNNFNDIMISKLNVLLKKFEIKKRIYVIYDKDYKEFSNKYDNLQNYLLLSLLCILYYEENKNLRFLNAALKINDTICSKKQEIISDTDQFLTKVTLEKEMNSINELLTSKGIQI